MYDKDIAIYLDMFFANSWASPGQQTTPTAWGQSLGTIKKNLRTYVKNSLVAFHEAGVQLEIVSLGNEISKGMLWPTGYVNVLLNNQAMLNKNFTNFASLWKSARLGVSDAVAAGVPAPSVMLQLDGYFKTGAKQKQEAIMPWLEAFFSSGFVKTTDLDIFGMSFYPFYSPAATFSNLTLAFNEFVAKYNKPVMVVETNWPELCDGKYEPIPNFTENFPISAEGQLDWMDGIINVLQNVPNGMGKGLYYWEPAWLNNTALGSKCEDLILFDQDWSGWPNEVVGYSRNSTQMFIGLT